MSADIIPIRSNFNPLSRDAEQHYDRVAHRVNQLTAERNQKRRLVTQLERQFVDDDLIATSGARRGRPLTPAGRRRRLKQLLDEHHELCGIEEEHSTLLEELEIMNEALDTWARETYGS